MGLVRSPLAPLCTDGPCYALVVLLIGNFRDTPFCSFGVDEGTGKQGRARDRQAQTLKPFLSPVLWSQSPLGEVRMGAPSVFPKTPPPSPSLPFISSPFNRKVPAVG